MILYTCIRFFRTGIQTSEGLGMRQRGRRNMIFIGGISSAVKQLNYLKTVICSRCGGYGRYQVFMTYTYFSFFFIPVFKWNRQFYVKMSCCGSVYELDREVGMKILRGESVDIREEDLTLIKAGGRSLELSDFEEERTCPGCGASVSEDYSYCPYCGEPLDRR